MLLMELGCRYMMCFFYGISCMRILSHRLLAVSNHDGTGLAAIGRGVVKVGTIRAGAIKGSWDANVSHVELSLTSLYLQSLEGVLPAKKEAAAKEGIIFLSLY